MFFILLFYFILSMSIYNFEEQFQYKWEAICKLICVTCRSAVPLPLVNWWTRQLTIMEIDPRFVCV